MSLFISLLIGANASAQVANYGFTAFSGTFTPIVGGTATSIAATADFGISTAFPIGFNFVYNGISYTQVQATSDGVLLFGTGKAATGTNNLATTTATQRPGVAALWDDLQCTSGVTYQLSGTPGSQVLTVQWLNMEWSWSNNAPTISFQVKLYEGTNIIDIIYRQEAQPVNTVSASIGIMGVTPTDYISLQNTSAAPTISTTASTNTLNTKPATDQVYRFIGPPPAPAAPTQDPTPPSCATGTQILATGTPPAGITWFWQTTANGTSTANPATAPWTVFANGTYFIRAFDATNNIWSTNSASITISNFPLATAPTGLAAAQNPACAPAGTTITVPTPPAGVDYYWQGTTANGTSTALHANVPFPVTTTGTYHVAAFDNTTSCWSNTTSLLVTVDTQIPNNPSVSNPILNICTGATTGVITATTTSNNPGSLATTQAGGSGCGSGNMFNLTTGASPINITSFVVTPFAT